MKPVHLYVKVLLSQWHVRWFQYIFMWIFGVWQTGFLLWVPSFGWGITWKSRTLSQYIHQKYEIFVRRIILFNQYLIMHQSKSNQAGRVSPRQSPCCYIQQHGCSVTCQQFKYHIIPNRSMRVIFRPESVHVYKNYINMGKYWLNIEAL